MAQTTFSVRMDADLKRDLDALCSALGMSTSTAINIFAKTAVREQKIPFELALHNEDSEREKGRAAFWRLREQAQKSDLAGMSLDEINEEIRKVREGIGNDE